jgi:prepilin-type N-terminal cleavage/methylation domain-containing protein
MRRLVRERDGFTMIEVIVGLVLLTMLSGVAVAAYTGHREEAARVPLLADLDNAVEMYQQSTARGEPVGSFGELRAAGLTLSDGVTVEAASIENDRLYVRVKHANSHRRCSVDYSASSLAAKNRKQCWGGRGDPSVEESRVADGAAPGAADTFTVAMPDAPSINPDQPEDVFIPSVSDPADQAGNPGQSLSQTFRVTNRGPARRGYLLRATTSNPRSATGVSAPSRIEVAAGGSQNVTVSYRLDAAATADERARIDLEATDEGDPRYAGRGAFQTGVRLVLAAPDVTPPGAKSAKPGEMFTAEWRVRNRTNAERTLVLSASASGDLEVVSGVGLGNAPFYAGEERSVTVTYRVKPGSVAHHTHTATLVAEDRASPAHRTTETFTFTTAVDLKAPSIVPPPPVTVRPDSVFVLRYRVKNESNEPRDLVVVEQSPAQVAVVGRSGTGTVRFDAFEEKTVDISHRILEPSTSGTVYRPGLRVSDQLVGSLARDVDVAVTTGVWLKAPSVVSKPGDAGLKPDSSVTVAWQIRNESNEPRTLILTPDAGSELTVAGSSGSGRVAFVAYETRLVSVTYRLAGGSIAGSTRDGVLSVTDDGNSSLSMRSTFLVTTLVDERDPVLTAPAGRSADPGTSGSAIFTLRNPTNAQRSFTFSTATSNSSVAAKPGVPPGVTVPAFGSTPVSLPYTVQAGAAGNASTVLTLTATSNTSRSTSATVSLTANVVRRPATLSNPGARQAYKGSTDQFSITITNHSNITENLAPAISSGNTGIAGSPTVVSHNCAGVPMGSACTATLRWSAVEKGSTQLSMSAGTGAAQSATRNVAVSVPNRAPNKPNLTVLSSFGGSFAVESGRVRIYSQEDEAVFTIRGTDPDGDALIFSLPFQGSNGTASGSLSNGVATARKRFAQPGGEYVDYDLVVTTSDGSVSVVSDPLKIRIRTPVYGCRDSYATNYDPNATHEAPAGDSRGCRYGMFHAPQLVPLFAAGFVDGYVGQTNNVTYRLTNMNEGFSDSYVGEASARAVWHEQDPVSCGTDVFGFPYSEEECRAQWEYWKKFWEDSCEAYKRGEHPGGIEYEVGGGMACEIAKQYQEGVTKPDKNRPQPHTTDLTFQGEASCQNLAPGASCIFTHTWKVNSTSIDLAGYEHQVRAWGQEAGDSDGMVGTHAFWLRLMKPFTAAFSIYQDPYAPCYTDYAVQVGQGDFSEIESQEWYWRDYSPNGGGGWGPAHIPGRYYHVEHYADIEVMHVLRSKWGIEKSHTVRVQGPTNQELCRGGEDGGGGLGPRG